MGSVNKVKNVGKIDFIYINGGEFLMGNDDETIYEKPKHKVNVSSFWISKYEITQKQYLNIMLEVYKNEKYKISTPYVNIVKNGGNYPIHQINWAYCIEFCEVFSKKYNVKARLPFEAEWEYACRAGTKTKYFWGNDTKVADKYCWYYDNQRYYSVQPVGLKKPNKWGLHDMIGNALEWCMDEFLEDYYQYSPKINPKGPKIKGNYYKVMRGGYYSSKINDLRVTKRFAGAAYRRNAYYGMRIVLEIDD